MSFTFRIRFFLNEDARIKSKKQKLTIKPDEDSEKEFVLKSKEQDTPIEETGHLVLLGPNYPTEEEATHKGELTKKALTLLGVRNQLGLDLGRDVASGGFTEEGKEILKNKIGSENVKIRNDKLGLDVYPTDKENIFVNSHAKAVAKRDADNLRSDFCNLWQVADGIGDNVKLAAELYNLARRSVSDNTRLITTVSAVDTLSPSKKRPEQIKNYIDCLISQVEELREILKTDENWDKGEIDNEVKRLKSHIGWFKEYSIRQKSKFMITEKVGDNEYCGQKPEALFDECYSIRNDIIHNGPSAVDKEVDMKRKANCMDQLARDLILQFLET